MDIKTLHERFKDDHSPSVEGQIRWLQKQGFPQHHIEQAMAEMYADIERGDLPKAYEKLSQDDKVIQSIYLPKEVNSPGKDFAQREISNGWDLDQALLEYAKRARTDELGVMLKNIERFEQKLRKKWMKQVPWYKRVFGSKPKDPDITEVAAK